MTDNTDDNVTIPRKMYTSLIRQSAKLRALENFGVDNWEWYDEALRDYYNTENN